MKTLIAISVAFLAFSCSPRENGKTVPGNSIDIIARAKPIDEDKHINDQRLDTITMAMEDENGIYSALGIIDSLHPRIYVKFSNEDTGNLYAVITPLKGDGNIRFSQILFPDKTADGPFGKDVALVLRQTGQHTLIIGHSLMAENPYSGKFKIDLQVAE